jgi:hypothetical protein
MIENLIVALIVIAAFASAARRYLAPKAKGGCGSGSAGSCSSCKACSDPVPPPQTGGRRIIPLRVER